MQTASPRRAHRGGRGDAVFVSKAEGPRPACAQQEQQTGMPFMQTQQTQPDFIMAVMQSQQAWIILQHSASPLVQVMTMPSAVASHLHMAMAMLQQHIIMPFIIMQQEHIPPAIMVQRFCIICADIASSHLQTIRIPPSHFSMVMVQRGTIIIWPDIGIVEPEFIIPPMPMFIPMPMFAIALRSIIMVVICASPRLASGGSSRPLGGLGRLTVLLIRHREAGCK